jgi:hypothetical protein
MSATDQPENRREELTARLRELDETFEREMRARGFDPSQVENVALTSELARLYAAREEIRTEIDDLSSPGEVKGQTQHD